MFTDAERAALSLAERMTTDARGVDEELWAELRFHYDEGEIIEMAAVIGLFNYFNRFNDALRVEITPPGGQHSGAPGNEDSDQRTRDGSRP
jgi:alkylhydroperoxidase family enzyme